MKQEMVAIYDNVSETWSLPMAYPAIGAAVRDFQDEVNKQEPNNKLNRHPKDFALYHVGTWDQITGDWTNTEQGNRLLIRATEALNRPETENEPVRKN